jgi:hypothetical protein
MNRKRLLGCLASAGLVLMPAADLLASGGTAGAAAPATAASSADSVDGCDVRVGWEKAPAAIRQLQHPDRDAAAPSGVHPDWKAEGNQVFALFGSSVATAGDVNGDGYDDVIVGAPFYANGQVKEGRVFVYHGSASGLSATADWTAESDQIDANFGISVGTAGDVNGDGYDDVIVGAPSYNNIPNLDEGKAFVYHGSASGLSPTPDWTARSYNIGVEFGNSVGTAGDVNGDGYDDVIVGADDYGECDEGAAVVYHGSPSGLSATRDWGARGHRDFADFGRSVGTAGDVNGDGYDDVIVGAPSYADGYFDIQGRAFVYHGSASGLSMTSDWFTEPNQFSASYGWSVGTAGDVNGDGYDDVIVGARLYDNPHGDEGGAFVFQGSASGLSLSPDWIGDSGRAEAEFGTSVGTAGDLNGDGYDDVIVGAWTYDYNLFAQKDEGRAFVYYGSASGLPTTPNWTAESNQAEAHFGFAVGTAGDVNGDGYDDVIGGAPNYDHGQDDEGVAVVFHGRATAAMPR